MKKSASEIIQEQGIQITSSPTGGYKAVNAKAGIVLHAKTLEKLLRLIQRAFGEEQ